MLGLAAEAFGQRLWTRPKNWREPSKELKESVTATSHQTENFDNEIGINSLNKSQVDVLELKSSSN